MKIKNKYKKYKNFYVFDLCFLFFIFYFLFSSCGSQTTTGEDYGDLMASPAGLGLTEDEHKYGWGRSDCAVCHNFSNIHISESESGYDMEAVRNQVAEDGLSSCATCHGGNGVE